MSDSNPSSGKAGSTRRVVILDRRIIFSGGHTLTYASGLARDLLAKGLQPTILAARDFKKDKRYNTIRKDLAKEGIKLEARLHGRALNFGKPPKKKRSLKDFWIGKSVLFGPGGVFELYPSIALGLARGHFEARQGISTLSRLRSEGVYVPPLWLAAPVAAVGLVFLGIFRLIRSVFNLFGYVPGMTGAVAAVNRVLRYVGNAITAPFRAIYTFGKRIVLLWRMVRNGIDERVRIETFAWDLMGLVSSGAVKAGDLVIVPTCLDDDMAALEEARRRRKRLAKIPFFLIMREPPFRDERRIAEMPESRRSYRTRMVYALLSGEPEATKLFSDTRENCDQIKRLASCDVTLLPIPVPVEMIEAGASPKTDEVSPAKRPLRVAYVGEARREKGFHILHDIITYVRLHSPSDRFNLRIQSYFEYKELIRQKWKNLDTFKIGPSHPMNNPLVRIVDEARTRLRWRHSDIVELLEAPLTEAEYAHLVTDCDIGLQPLRAQQYRHGSTGSITELMVAGKPYVAFGELWGTRQLRNTELYNRHFADLAQTFGVNSFMVDNLAPLGVQLNAHWMNLEHLWPGYDPDVKTSESKPIFWRNLVTRPETTHLVVRAVKPGKLEVGDYMRVGVRHLSSLRYAADEVERHAYTHIAPIGDKPYWRYFTAGRNEAYAILPVDQVRASTDGVEIVGVMLDPRVRTDRVQIEVTEVAIDSETTPVSAAAMLVDHPFELGAALIEIGRHYDHYRRTAREIAAEFAPFHNQDKLISIFMDEYQKSHAAVTTVAAE